MTIKLFYIFIIIKKLVLYKNFKNSRLSMKRKVPEKPVALDDGPSVWNSRMSVDLEL